VPALRKIGERAAECDSKSDHYSDCGIRAGRSMPAYREQDLRSRGDRRLRHIDRNRDRRLATIQGVQMRCRLTVPTAVTPGLSRDRTLLNGLQPTLHVGCPDEPGMTNRAETRRAPDLIDQALIRNSEFRSSNISPASRTTTAKAFRSLALAGLEAAIGLVDDVGAATAADHAVIAMPVLERLQ